MCNIAHAYGATMNWDDLRLFLAVAREGSISGAARVLNVEHSTVSRRIQALERKLGVRLIERKKSGYELTPAGESLRSSASKVEHEVLQVDGNLGGLDAKLTGELRVSAINNMASSILMPMFARFSQKYPAVELHLLVSNRYISLAEREADVVIRLTNTPADNLIGKRLITVASTIYASSSYLELLRSQGGKPIWLGVTCCGFHQTWTKNVCGGYRHNFFVDDTLMTVAALKQDLGLAYLPCFMGDREPELERYCPPDPQLNLGLWLLFHPDFRKTTRVLAFRDHMVDEIKTQRDLFEGKAFANK